MSAIKIGIVGAGGMAAYHYAGFVKAGAEVIAMANTDINRARAFGEARNIRAFYPSLTAMLKACPELNAVSIITPNKFHKPLALEAFASGKHVYCEKPPALNATETRAMLDASRTAGKQLMFDLNNRARPEVQAVMRYIRDGRVGRINSAQAYWIRRAGIPGFGGWFTNKELAGGGPALDLPHMVDIALHFMGYPEPDWLIGSTYNDFMDNRAFKGPWGFPDSAAGVTDVESSCHAMLTFKTGQCLMFRNSWAELNERETISVTFQGSKVGGKIERLFGIDGIDETSIDVCKLFFEEYGKHVDLDIAIAKDKDMGRITNASNFIESLEGRAPPLNTPEEAVTLMRIIDALYESAASRQPVQLG
jgi:predicted dehydrogenase